MRKIDKLKNIQMANMLSEQRYLQSKMTTTLNEGSKSNESINESEFGFGEFPKPKTEIWIQFMNRATKDGLISQIHYGDKRIQNIAKELANEFENMEELNRQSNKELFLGLFYDRIPKWAWGEPTNSILMKYDLRKS